METDTLKPDHEDLGDIEAPASPKPSRINLNDYKGYEPPLGVSFAIDRVSADVEPKEFFEKYISARRPVIIEQHFKDCEWKGLEWNNKYLNDKAGDAEVLVEKRSTDTGGMFGLSAPKVSMKYREFLEEIEKGSEQYYLTTQDLERFQDDLDDFDMPKSVLAEPLKSLKQDFPLRPGLLGKLIPYQVSLWQGHSSGASSGLHHDFHDNLYVLIRGQKRFRIFPPSGAPHMSTMGRPIKIHTNGLIVYQSHPVNPTINVRADGVPLAFLARQKRIEAEQELAAAEEEMYSIQDSTDMSESAKDVEIRRLQGIILDCEDRIDLAMEEMLQYGNTFDYDYRSDEDVISVHDDESELDDVSDDDDDNAPKEVVSQSCQKEEEGDRQPPTKVMRLANGSRAIVTKGDDSKPDSEKIEKIPDHFCNVVLPNESDDAEEILSKFAEKDRIRCLSIVIKSGEMLYLPASWFHEVSSYSGDSGGGEAARSDSQGHLALNYWLFPPDGDMFDFPYRDDFWPKRWRSIEDEKIGIHSTSRRQFPLPVDSSEIISLDSDSDDDESGEDSDDDDDDDADAIVVGDDSLLGSSDDEPIVIESQASAQKTCNNAVEINSSLDVSIGGNFPNNDNLDGADLDSSVSDGILDGSDEEDSLKTGANDPGHTDAKDSSEAVEGAESRVSLALECPDLPKDLEDVQNSEVSDSRNALGLPGKTNGSDVKSIDELSKTLEIDQSNNLSSVT